MPPIYKALDISTEHMTSKDAELLERYSVTKKGRQRPPGGALIVDPIGEYGWTISISQLYGQETAGFLQALRDEGYSEGFVKVLEYARGFDVAAVRFDRDADPDPDLPRFDWENGDSLLVDDDTPPSP